MVSVLGNGPVWMSLWYLTRVKDEIAGNDEKEDDERNDAKIFVVDGGSGELESIDDDDDVDDDDDPRLVVSEKRMLDSVSLPSRRQSLVV